MDLCAASDFLLIPHLGIQPVPAQCIQPLPDGTIGLILGRGSLTLQGLVVYPGLIDNQHQMELQILCSSPNGVFSIKKGDRIAQVILLPCHQPASPADVKRPMGSTGQDSAYLIVQLHSRPKLKLQINGKTFEGILDTGADKSIISSHWWPKSWPITDSSHSLQGLGYQSCPSISTSTLTWTAPEGQQGQFTPYVLPLPVNLWGRDVMQSLGLALSNEYSAPAQDMMRNMGYVPGQGLGKFNQGRTTPVSANQKMDRHGLGFS